MTPLTRVLPRALSGLPVFASARRNHRRGRGVVVSYRHAQRLHADVAGSILDSLPGGSHMVHHVPRERVLHAVDSVASQFRPWPCRSM